MIILELQVEWTVLPRIRPCHTRARTVLARTALWPLLAILLGWDALVTCVRLTAAVGVLLKEQIRL